MKRSKYNLTVSNSGYHLIFNELNNSCVVLNDECYFRYLNNELDELEINNLSKLGIVVSDSLDETLFYITKREKFRKAETENSLIFRLLLTTFCNANCYYCYESNLSKEKMSDDTIKILIDRIKTEAIDKKKLIIEWFGGEPLVEYKKINFISKELISFCIDNKIEYKAHLITNGYNFKYNKIRESFSNWHLERVQITLDGLKDTYENTKQFKEKNSFETIISNINFILSTGIKLDVRLNYDADNIGEILALIDFLSNRFKQYANLNVYAHRIFNSTKFANVSDTECDNQILNKLRVSGFLKDIFPSFGLRMGCQANRENGGTVMPDGSIFRCSLAATEQKFCLGNINSKVNPAPQWTDNSLEGKCFECIYLPICGGGCSYSKLCGNYSCLIDPKLVESQLQFALEEFINNHKEAIQNVDY